jgi:hypothetical protein
MTNRPFEATRACDVLGINRTRWEVAAMHRALSFHPWLNSDEENTRKVWAFWALANWRAYQDECNSRRNNRNRGAH